MSGLSYFGFLLPAELHEGFGEIAWAPGATAENTQWPRILKIVFETSKTRTCQKSAT